jgi:hypothetical protein
MFHNRQPQAESSVRSSGRLIGLPKPIEHKRNEFLGDPHTRIDDRHDDALGIAADADSDRPAVGCELHRVTEQVPENLLQPFRVAVHGAV